MASDDAFDRLIKAWETVPLFSANEHGLWLIGSAVTYKLGLAFSRQPRAFNVVDLYAWPAILLIMVVAGGLRAARLALEPRDE